MVAEILPPSLMGDYHLGGTTSPAYGAGNREHHRRWGPGPLGWSYTVSSPRRDIDGDRRPSGSPPPATTPAPTS